MVASATPLISFASQKGYQRAKDLQFFLVAGKIANLRFCTSYPLVVNDVEVGRYIDDANYDDLEHGGIHIVEDTKTSSTRKLLEYRRSRRLMKELYDIEIVEL